MHKLACCSRIRNIVINAVFLPEQICSKTVDAKYSGSLTNFNLLSTD